jgi:hypothetical protein
MPKDQTCRECSETFTPPPKKPDYVNVCPRCGPQPVYPPPPPRKERLRLSDLDKLARRFYRQMIKKGIPHALAVAKIVKYVYDGEPPSQLHLWLHL